MKKILVPLLTVIMALSFVACTGPSNNQSSSETQSNTLSPKENNVQIPNPFVDCENLEEAAKIAGFSMTLPQVVLENCGEIVYRAIEDSMIEIVCTQDNEELRIRKVKGLSDISGDYNEYPESSSIQVGDATVLVKGSNGKVSVATWNNDDYSFALTTNKEMDVKDIQNIIADIQ